MTSLPEWSHNPALSLSISPSGDVHRREQLLLERAKRSGPQGYIEEMIEEGFFDNQKTLAEVKAELENRGHHIPITTLSKPLQRLCQSRTLRRQKIESNGNRKTFGYSKW
jgi:hypothetical protein